MKALRVFYTDDTRAGKNKLMTGTGEKFIK